MAEKHRDGQVITLSTRTFMKVVLIGVGGWFLWFIRDILLMILVAVLLAALIEPFAKWFEDHRVPRGLAVLIVYVVLGALLTGVLVYLIPVLIEQAVQLFSSAALMYERFLDSFGQFQTIAAEHGFAQNVQGTLEGLQREITAGFASVFSTVKGFFGGLAALFIVLVLAFYIVVEENSVRTFVKQIAPAEYQSEITTTMTKMQKKIGAWLRGQIILGLIVGVSVYIGLSLIGVEYALLLAIIAGLLEIVPYIGPILSFVPAAIIAFAQSPLIGVLTGVLYLLIQQVENNVLVPKVMQKVTGLNPIVSVIALLVGLKIAGVGGAILAIPVATMGTVVLEDLFHYVST